MSIKKMESDKTAEAYIREIKVNSCTSIHTFLAKTISQSNSMPSCQNSPDHYIEIPIDGRNIIEVHCKGLVSCFFAIVPESVKSELKEYDEVLVTCGESLEIATVKTVGDLVKIKRQRLGLYGEDLPTILRKVGVNDEAKIAQNIKDELKARESFKAKSKKYNLEMKLVDVHFQYDRNKLYFFYTADGRVDFRELAKDLAGEFKTRIELRQIGVRDEAKKIGGIGACGREYCCSSFMEDFKRISTNLASEQNLLANISKLSGPCGKLKCCLSFEADQYAAASDRE